MLLRLFDSRLDDAHVPFDPPRWINIVTVLSLVGTMLLAVFIYLGVVLAVLALLTTVLAVGAWLGNGYAQPISRRILPIHIIAVIANLLQGAEQHAGQYALVIQTLFPALIQESNRLTNENFAAVFSLTTASMFLGGAAMVFYQARVGGFVAWWLFMWSILFPVSHYLLPLFSASGFSYVPGMITAPLTMAVGVIGTILIKRFKTTSVV